VLLLSSSCSKSAAISNDIEFFELTFKKSAGIQHRIDTSKSELQVWHSDHPGGLIVVTRDDLAGQNIDYRKSIPQVFAEQAKSIESGLEGEKFLGPAAYFKSKTLEHYGGSWRLPGGKMYSLTYTWVEGAVFRIYCQFPSAKGASTVDQKGRKALQDTFGSIEKKT
jgi:hypothetical protein